MTGTSLTVGNLAKLGGAKTCTDWTETRTVSALQEAVTNLIKFQNPYKTWAFVAEAFGLRERAAKHRLANNSAYTIEELQVLFQGEDGEAYFDAMMADAAPAWYVFHKQVRAQAAKRRLIAEQTQEALELESRMPPTAQARRLTKGNADATKKLNSAFVRKETALGFLDPKQDRAAAGPVAQAQSKKPALRAYAGRGR